MTVSEIREAIRSKTIELELATEAGRPRKELLDIYRELKSLRYRLTQLELDYYKRKDKDPA